MNDFTRMKYIQKLRTADQVAGMVSSGDRIFFGEFVLRPDTLDEALARRAKQLSNVIIEGVCITTVPRFIEADSVGSTSSIMTGTSGVGEALPAGIVQLCPLLSPGASGREYRTMTSSRDRTAHGQPGYLILASNS